MIVLVADRQARLLAASPLAAAWSLVPFPGGAAALAAAILRHRARIAHIDGSTSALLAAKLAGVRAVFHPGPRAPAWALKLADVVVARTPAERAALEQRAPGACVAVVPQAIDPAPYLRYNRRTFAELRLLSWGGILPGVLYALQALAGKGLKPRLTISGSGREEPLLRAQVRALRLGGQVRFAGPAWGEYKAKLLSDADALLAAGEGEEVLEGMAAGVVPLEPGKDLAQRIEALHADRADLARRSQACRQRILSDHTPARVAEDFSAIYSVLVPWQASQAG